MIARQSVWTDAEVLKLAANFIPVADEVHRLQTGKDAECMLFQEIGEQGHYGGRPGTTRQGTYAATPSGVLLASINSNDPKRIAQMLEKALAKWQTLSRKERLMPEDPDKQSSKIKRPERNYPEGGLVLHVYTRDLPRESSGKGWRANAWNQDYAWFKKHEARQFLPEQPKVGDKHEVPSLLARRIARFHLVDNVRGQTIPFDNKHIEKAQLTTQVSEVKGNLVSLRLEGATRARAMGKWPIRGYRDSQNPAKQERGFETKLLGKATYDLEKQRFIAFEMVALGTRWGATQFNERRNDLEPSDIGVLFTLAGDRPAERVAPAFHYAYDWGRE